jgi:tetratricopeptide (TPR) repeat protein
VRQGGTEWWLPYLVASEAVFAGARYVGKAHEYLDLSPCIPPDRTLARLDSPFVDRRGAGADEERKEWYLRMLREDLVADPQDARAAFYIANTLRDLGRLSEALEAYLRRAATPGFVEETFLSIYEAGLCLARLNENPTAMRVLLGAAQFRPTRPEPLHALAQLANLQGEHMSAFAFAERGMLIPPTTDSLFVRRSVRTWGLALERAVAMWWLGRQNEAYGEFERLLSADDVPDEVRERIHANLAKRDAAP